MAQHKRGHWATPEPTPCKRCYRPLTQDEKRDYRDLCETHKDRQAE